MTHLGDIVADVIAELHHLDDLAPNTILDTTTPVGKALQVMLRAAFDTRADPDDTRDELVRVAATVIRCVDGLDRFDLALLTAPQ